MDKWDKLMIAIAALLIALWLFVLVGCTPQGQQLPEGGRSPRSNYYTIERREFPQDGNVCYTYRGVMDCLPLAEKRE